MDIEIIGNGDIASALKAASKTSSGLKTGRLYFASGVSNPNETNKAEFDRERKLLLSQRKDLQIVYFSSLSVLDPQKPYSLHKLQMEKLVMENFPSYAIARLGIISWGKNPNTTINFLKHCVKKHIPFEVRDVSRDVIEKDKFIKQVNALPKNAITEIRGELLTELEIFRKYVSSDFPL